MSNLIHIRLGLMSYWVVTFWIWEAWSIWMVTLRIWEATEWPQSASGRLMNGTLSREGFRPDPGSSALILHTVIITKSWRKAVRKRHWRIESLVLVKTGKWDLCQNPRTYWCHQYRLTLLNNSTSFTLVTDTVIENKMWLKKSRCDILALLCSFRPFPFRFVNSPQMFCTLSRNLLTKTPLKLWNQTRTAQTTSGTAFPQLIFVFTPLSKQP